MQVRDDEEALFGRNIVAQKGVEPMAARLFAG